MSFTSQLKNVHFDFVPKPEEDGVFEVHARFMGVSLEHVELDIQVKEGSQLRGHLGKQGS